MCFIAHKCDILQFAASLHGVGLSIGQMQCNAVRCSQLVPDHVVVLPFCLPTKGKRRGRGQMQDDMSFVQENHFLIPWPSLSKDACHALSFLFVPLPHLLVFFVVVVVDCCCCCCVRSKGMECGKYSRATVC